MRKASAKKTATATPAKKAVRTRKPKEAPEEVAPSRQVPEVSLDSFGLRKNLEYVFLANGLVDWRRMISDEHILLNKEKFLKKDEPVDVEALSKEEFLALKAKAREDELIIKLTGYRELAAIRGFSSVKERVVCNSPDFVSVECEITWLPNYETDMSPVTYTGTADAHMGNCSRDFGSNYLTAIASNRAFARAVRNFLRVFIVSQDEISFEKPEEISNSVGAGPSSALEDKIGKAGLTFEQFKEKMSKEEYDIVGIEAWKTSKDIPSKYFPLIFAAISRWNG